MSVKQKKAREAALWALYGLDVAEQLAPEAAERFYPIASDLDPELTEVWHEVEARVDGVVAELVKIDEEIQKVSPRWRLERMAVIDRNILREGVWELFNLQTPPIVVINACVELAKDYGEQTTPAFVNGLLDQICKDHGIQISPESQ